MQDAYARAVADVLARTSYGVRYETALAPGWKVSWSNGNKSWFPYETVKKGQVVRLDANEIIVYAKGPYLKRIVASLPVLPLYKHSTEGKSDQSPDFLSNPRKPSPEEEWINQPERDDEQEYDYYDPTRSPHEGDIPPWAQSSYGGEFPMASRVYYVNGYVLEERKTGISYTANLGRRPSTLVGTFPPGLDMGSDAQYRPFAAIPVRREKEPDFAISYLNKLVQTLRFTFARIEIQASFPQEDQEGTNTGIVRLQDGRYFEYMIDPPFADPRLDFLNAYSTNRLYGGPEEGGWWYNAGLPIASVPILRNKSIALKNWSKYIQMDVGWHSKFDLGSVLGRDKFALHTEGTFASPYPRNTPHYE